MTESQTSQKPTEMSFLEHLAELRLRIFHILGGIVLGFVLAYIFSEELFHLLKLPFDRAYRAVFLKDPVIINTGLIEPFMVYLKVGLLGGLFLSSPYSFLQLWKFIQPGLTTGEKRLIFPFVFLTTLFFVGGASFGYFVVFPFGFEYFLRIGGVGIEPMIRMQEYFTFASWMLLVFGFVFEIPLVVLILAFFGIITTKHLVKPWRGILTGILIASAVLTPADPISMILLAIPMTALYGLTILVSFFVARKRKSQEIVTSDP